jgi:hypothetical protein
VTRTTLDHAVALAWEVPGNPKPLTDLVRALWWLAAWRRCYFDPEARAIRTARQQYDAHRHEKAANRRVDDAFHLARNAWKDRFI